MSTHMQAVPLQGQLDCRSRDVLAWCSQMRNLRSQQRSCPNILTVHDLLGVNSSRISSKLFTWMRRVDAMITYWKDRFLT